MAQLNSEPIQHQYSADGTDTEEFVATGDTSVVTDEYRSVMYRALDEGEALGFGDGTKKRPDQAEGFANVELYNSGSTQQHGQSRLVVRTKAGTLVGTITRFHTSQADTSRTDLPDGKPLPRQTVNGSYYVGGGARGYKVHYEVKGDSSFTFDYDNSSNVFKIDGNRVFM